jgi:hypothetical protein
MLLDYELNIASLWYNSRFLGLKSMCNRKIGIMSSLWNSHTKFVYVSP